MKQRSCIEAMKVVSSVALFLAAQVLCSNIPEEYYTLEDYTCMERVGVDTVYVSNGFNPITMKCTETEKYKQFMDCWQREMHMLDENDNVIPQVWEKWLVDVAFKFLEKSDNPNRYDLSKKFVENCKDITGDKQFDKAIKLWNCIVPQIAT
ncbi:hypothetical protein FQR65_LT02127 [Abscondita terminalis]|nr:hypothetical protein FQR65_LT02127 [Abscondita terminalis]